MKQRTLSVGLALAGGLTLLLIILGVAELHTLRTENEQLRAENAQLKADNAEFQKAMNMLFGSR